MLKVLKKLYQVNLITPAGLYKLFTAFFNSGINIIVLLRFSAKLYPQNIALVDDYEELTYTDLLAQTEKLTIFLRERYKVTPGQKIAIMCRNHSSLVRSVFSVAQSGADIYLLNVEMSNTQFNTLVNSHCFNLIIHDAEVAGLISQSSFKQYAIPAYHPVLPSIDSVAKAATTHHKKIRRIRSGKIIVLTGGTTGDFKTAERKASVSNFLPPFFAILNKLNLNAFRTVYIATPVYHGFGIASLFMSVTLGMKLFLLQKFDAPKACNLIQQHKIEVITLVPLMLSRLMKHDPAALGSLACIISGGAALSPALVDETVNKHGFKLFNLYGTSEAGVSILATPHDLRYSSKTAGKVIPGVRLKILDPENRNILDHSVGRICIKSRWSVKNNNSEWIETGDLGYQDNKGYYFLCGKIDDMIVSGGENVYPIELENILVQHREIKQAAVIGINDEEFGQRLKAFIVPAGGSTIDKEEILRWLSTRAARYQVPKQIEFLDEIPHTSLGKPDKKALY